MVERVDAPRVGVLIVMDDQLHPGRLGGAVAQLVHGAEFPGRVDMEERKGRGRRIKGLAREVQHHRAVLADRIEHHRLGRLGDELAQDMDALGFQPLQVG